MSETTNIVEDQVKKISLHRITKPIYFCYDVHKRMFPFMTDPKISIWRKLIAILVTCIYHANYEPHMISYQKDEFLYPVDQLKLLGHCRKGANRSIDNLVRFFLGFGIKLDIKKFLHLLWAENEFSICIRYCPDIDRYYVMTRRNNYVFKHKAGLIWRDDGCTTSFYINTELKTRGINSQHQDSIDWYLDKDIKLTCPNVKREYIFSHGMSPFTHKEIINNRGITICQQPGLPKIPEFKQLHKKDNYVIVNINSGH